MFSDQRRNFFKTIFGLSLLALLPKALPAFANDESSADKLVMVNGWVVLHSDLEPD